MTDTKLNARALKPAAEAETGLSDWGDPTFAERFAQAVGLIEAADMDAAGQAAAVAEDEHCWAMDFRTMAPAASWRVPMGIVSGDLPIKPCQSSIASTR